MESFAAWTARADAWLDDDHRLLTQDAGWRPRVARPELGIWSRKTADDKNDLFRWRLPAVPANADVVFDAFVHRLLEFHKAWTREFVGGHVVEVLSPASRVLYQRFDPGIPGIRARDLCSIEVVRELGPGVRLASFRSVDRLPAEPGCERIDWWGAALCTTSADGQSSELIYLDRENQGGSFPSWLMNLMMPRYLVLQAEAVQQFFTRGAPATPAS